MKQLFSLAAAALLAWGAQAQTTFNVDMTCAPEGFENVFVTGPWCGWCANDTYNTMTDPDGDGVYTVEVADLAGVVEYKYAINGFADQENLVNDMVDGATCAPVTDYAGYANRQIEAGSVASDYYGTCDGTCNDSNVAVDQFEVTFQLDVSQYGGPVTSAEIFGTFNGWNPFANGLSDDNADGIWETTISLDAGSQEFKFRLNGSVDEAFDGSESCTTAPGEYVNRVIEVTEAVTLPAVCWNLCTVCNAEPVPGCTDATACNYDAAATEDDGSCLFGDGPAIELSTMDAPCFDGMGSVMLDSLSLSMIDEGAVYTIGADTVPGFLELMPGDYTLVGTGADGCASDTMFTIGAPDELVIELTLISQDSGAGDGQAEATVTGGTPDYNVVWNNMTGMEANPDSLSGGLYTAVVTDANGCTATASLTMTVDGIVEFTALEGALFPVPVTDVLNVRLATPLNSAARVDIRDVQGRLIESTQMLPNQQLLVLDAASWNAGVYTIQISNEEARASWSFVK